MARASLVTTTACLVAVAGLTWASKPGSSNSDSEPKAPVATPVERIANHGRCSSICDPWRSGPVHGGACFPVGLPIVGPGMPDGGWYKLPPVDGPADSVPGLAIVKCQVAPTGHLHDCQMIKSVPGTDEAVLHEAASTEVIPAWSCRFTDAGWVPDHPIPFDRVVFTVRTRPARLDAGSH